jgi:ArsR family transcriptional regulator, arsenate/arsenite/antimonite-responsive transcriptional repressor
MADIFDVVADTTRRDILAVLLERETSVPASGGEISVSEIVSTLGLSQPTVSKHLKVLREAGLVRVRAEANRRVYALDPGPLNELDVWLAPYRRLWNERLDALGRHLDVTATEED